MTNRIKKLTDNIKSFAYGEEAYNLEIKISKELENNCSQDEFRQIEPYIGRFIVTKLGYLANGFNERLNETRTAEIKNNDFPKRRLIHLENGEIDMIIYDLLGPRLFQIGYKKEKKMIGPDPAIIGGALA